MSAEKNPYPIITGINHAEPSLRLSLLRLLLCDYADLLGLTASLSRDVGHVGARP